MAIKEIELKFFVGSSIEVYLQRAAEMGWTALPTEDQEDTYYTSTHKDFISTNECLRIRVKGSASELTWKPPSSNAMREKGQYWKQEVNVDITGQIDDVRALLVGLEFIEVVTVSKHRVSFRVDPKTILALDSIDPLGWFIEIETLAESSDEGTSRNIEVANCIGLQDCTPINVPYRDMVRAGRVYND